MFNIEDTFKTSKLMNVEMTQQSHLSPRQGIAISVVMFNAAIRLELFKNNAA